MKKILAWVLALTMVAAGSVGATLAYLVNTDEDVNVMTLGKVLIDQLEYERTDSEAEGEDADIQKCAYRLNSASHNILKESSF